MTKPYPLKSLLDLSQLRLDNAARLLGELLAKEMAASERSVLLVRYREEYEARFVAAAQTGIGPEAWSNYRAFLAQLDQAIAQAHHMVEASKQRTAAGQQAWLDQRGKVKAFDTLSQRHLSREMSLDSRREQKSQDEHSMRRGEARKHDD